jgi:hypothetical protein
MREEFFTHHLLAGEGRRIGGIIMDGDTKGVALKWGELDLVELVSKLDCHCRSFRAWPLTTTPYSKLVTPYD